MNLFLTRLSELVDLRNLYEELHKIHTISKNFKPNYNQCFDIFKGINCLSISNLSQ
jgi:hypothetical protein